MKLVRYGNPGKEKPVLIDADGKLRDLSGVIKDIDPTQLGDVALAKLRKLKTANLPLVRGKLFIRGGALWGPDSPRGVVGAMGDQMRQGGAGVRSADALDLELEEKL
jgi:hypothetical protein